MANYNSSEIVHQSRFLSGLWIVKTSWWQQTCKIVKAVMLEDLVQDPQELPHLGGDGLTREAKGQRQDLFIEL